MPSSGHYLKLRLNKISFIIGTLSIYHAPASFAKGENAAEKIRVMDKDTSRPDTREKISTLLASLRPLVDPNLIEPAVASFPYKIGDFQMECAKYVTKKTDDRGSTQWVKVANANSEEEIDRLENQYGENGEVELVLELNKDVPNPGDISLAIRVNDRFVVDRILATKLGKYQGDGGDPSDECTQEYKSMFSTGANSIFVKTDKTQCGSITSVVNTEINRAVQDNSKSKIKAGSYEIFVQHTIVDGNEKDKDRKLKNNVNVSCNFDPIKK